MWIVQGVFRSGTTALFRALRCDPELHCFYEPLHPNLLDHVREADDAHPDHEKSPLYAEYALTAEDFSERLDAHHQEDFAYRAALVDQNAEAPQLNDYLHCLAECSSPESVLQFNRAFWMVPWLADRFPESTFVHVVRDPRCVVWSQLTTACGTRVRMDWPLLGRWLPFSSGNLRNVFSRYAYHGAYDIRTYLESADRLDVHASEDAAIRRACRRIEVVRDARPFVQALALWGAQVDICHCHAQRTFGDQYEVIRYEDFCNAPVDTLQTIYAQHGKPIPDPVRRYANESVHTDSLAAWRQVPGAAKAFQDGIRHAGLEDLMETFNYA